jgi:hypothetical protein
VQHPDETLATYVKKTIETLESCIKNTCKTPEKLENTCVAIANHMQHLYETLATYV